MEQIILSSGSYIQISVTENQRLFARQLVEHSLRHHHVSNIWDKHETELSKTRMMRFTGSLGEVVFADTYHLPRPTRSFGATDGQDWGQDFLISAGDVIFSLDIKSMKRVSGILAPDYVLNIPASQLHKSGSKTSHYFCISFHQSQNDGTVASLLGFIDKQCLESGEIGKFYKAGTRRMRSDQTFFTFNQDTYEILFSEIAPPVVTNYIQKLSGFKVCRLKN
jgi:hypothetical protein